MRLSIKFPGAQSFAFQIVEQCRVGVWAEEYDQNVHIAGETDAVKKALARFRVLRTNGYPNCIVLRDPVQEYFDDDGECTTEQRERAWYSAFGSVHAYQVRVLGKKLGCMIESYLPTYESIRDDLQRKIWNVCTRR